MQTDHLEIIVNSDPAVSEEFFQFWYNNSLAPADEEVARRTFYQNLTDESWKEQQLQDFLPEYENAHPVQTPQPLQRRSTVSAGKIVLGTTMALTGLGGLYGASKAPEVLRPAIWFLTAMAMGAEAYVVLPAEKKKKWKEGKRGTWSPDNLGSEGTVGSHLKDLYDATKK